MTTPIQPDQINVAKEEAQADAEGWLHRSLVAFDICCNVIFFRGRQGETISSHCYRAALEGHLWGKILNGALDLIQTNHGADAAAGDLARAKSIVATLEQTLARS